MLRGLTVLLVCQLVGEVVARVLGIPVPGPVLGLLLLLGLLAVWERPAVVEAAAAPLLRHLSLLFVPAGVGVVQQLDLVRAEWLPLVGALLGGTAATLLVTGHVFQRLLPVR